MAVIVKTENPSSLLTAIKKAIADGDIQTWSYDADGDFTHTAEQWIRRAWFRPSIHDDRLVFNMIPPRTRNISRVVYGVYHGRFIEMLLNHFDKRFTDVSATALPTRADRIIGCPSGEPRGRWTTRRAE
jgi:hypothetical protein